MEAAYIVAAARTAGGRRGGRLTGWHPADLAGQVLDALIDRSGADPALVEDVIMGCVSQFAQQSGNVARNAVLSSRLPESVPGTSVDRQCGSSQQALHFAAATVMSGQMDVVIAAGVESMSRVPMGMAGKLAHEANLGSPFAGPGMAARYPGVQFSQFTGAEMLAAKHDLSRDDLDAFGFASQQRAAAAVRSGAFDAEIVPVTVTLPDGSSEAHHVDEGIRFDASLDAVRGVKLITEGGRLTAATSSQIADGASGVMVVNDRGLKALGLAPLARIHHMTVVGEDPVIMLEAPIGATRRALAARRDEHRRDRPVRGQRGVRQRAAGVAQGDRRRPGAVQRQRRRDRPRPPARRVGDQADDDVGPCAAGARQEVGPADDVRRRRAGQRHHRRGAVSARLHPDPLRRRRRHRDDHPQPPRQAQRLHRAR